MDEVLNFVRVLVVTVGVACSVGALYASALRLWLTSESANGTVVVGRRVGAVALLVVCAAVVLVALWLIIPAFHH